MSQVCRLAVTLLGASASELRGSGQGWVALFWAPGGRTCENMRSEPQPGGEAQHAEEGAPPLAHLAMAGGRVSSFGNLRTCDRERHLSCLPSAWTPLTPGSEPSSGIKPRANISYLAESAKPVSGPPPSSLASLDPAAASRLAVGTGQQPADRQSVPLPSFPPPSKPRRPATHPAQRHLLRAQAMLRQDGLQRLMQPLGGLGRDPHYPLQRLQLEPAGNLRSAQGRRADPAPPRNPPVPAPEGRSLSWGERPVWVWGLSLGGGVITSGGTCRGDTGGGTEPGPRGGERGHSLEGDPVLQPHFLVRQHHAVLVQDQSLLQTPGRVRVPPSTPSYPRCPRKSLSLPHRPL